MLEKRHILETRSFLFLSFEESFFLLWVLIHFPPQPPLATTACDENFYEEKQALPFALLPSSQASFFQIKES